MSYTDIIRNQGNPPDGWENYEYVIEVPNYDTETICDLKSIGWKVFNRTVNTDNIQRITSESLWLGKPK